MVFLILREWLSWWEGRQLPERGTLGMEAHKGRGIPCPGYFSTEKWQNGIEIASSGNVLYLGCQRLLQQWE